MLGWRTVSARRSIALALVLASCGSGGSDDGPDPDGGAQPDAGADAADAGGDTEADQGTPDAPGDAPQPDGGCASGAHVETLVCCLDQGQGPDACLAALNATLCDTDGDELGDDLELAMARAYAPAFAFNGGAFGGNPETHWPASAAHFLAHANVTYRPDGKPGVVVDPAPTAATVALASSGGHVANQPGPGEGSDFWLCLVDATDQTRVASKSLMLSLPGGIDLVTIVHPANGLLGQSSHLFAFFDLVFAYNAHSLVDDHEGDWEGVGVFVDRKTGAVDAVWFERHDTTDNVRFVDAATYGTRDPAQESPAGDVKTTKPSLHGLRFWDFAGLRHHVVAYVGTGAHAMYDYPANTFIAAVGPRDTHNGDGDKLLPWLDQLVPGWAGTAGTPLSVSELNAGEAGSISLDWARFRGQWGCNDGVVAKSWPGPFGNARHPRPVLEQTWGSPPAP